MSTAWEWLDASKTIAVVSMRGNWAQNDLEAFTKDFWPQLKQQPHLVDVIVDLKNRGGVALPMQPLRDLIWLAQNRPSNAGRIVFIVRRTSGLALVRALNYTIQRLYPKLELLAALTQEEAVRLLSKHRVQDTSNSLAQAGNQSPTEFR